MQLTSGPGVWRPSSISCTHTCAHHCESACVLRAHSSYWRFSRIQDSTHPAWPPTRQPSQVAPFHVACSLPSPLSWQPPHDEIEDPAVHFHHPLVMADATAPATPAEDSVIWTAAVMSWQMYLRHTRYTAWEVQTTEIKRPPVIKELGIGLGSVYRLIKSETQHLLKRVLHHLLCRNIQVYDRVISTHQ